MDSAQLCFCFQWINHLGSTHFVIEPILIAAHNVLLREDHPLYDLLKPAGRDTLFMTFIGIPALFPLEPLGFGDIVSSVGSGQALQLMANQRLSYDFFNSSALPLNLEMRGLGREFSGIPGYYFREDGLKLWDAYGAFVAAFVDEVYVTDENVTGDMILQEWAMEVSDPRLGNVRGFPASFSDKATLTLTLQSILWVAGGLHAALNFPQFNVRGQRDYTLFSMTCFASSEQTILTVFIPAL